MSWCWLMLLLIPLGHAQTLTVPAGLDAYLPVPENNPLTEDKVALGKSLFFDKRLSLDESLSCATCHDPQMAFSDRNARSKGVGGRTGERRTPRIVNRVYGTSFFWDGRVARLEDQVLEPLLNPNEMGMTLDLLPVRVGLSVSRIRLALASYVRTILSGDSPYDRYLAGDRAALSEQQLAGLRLFRGKAGCTACHLGPNFTDEKFHNTGIGWPADEGRYRATKAAEDRGAFKTPTLRDCARTPPYMHDGSLKSLEDVIEFYAKGGNANPRLDPEIRELRLRPDEKQALAAFLEALNGKIRDGW